MNNNRYRIIAAGITLAIALLVLTVLLTVKIAPAVIDALHAEQPEEAEVFFADIEYKEIKHDPTPEVDGNPASAAATELGGTDIADAGSGEGAPDLVARPADPKPKGEQVAKPEVKEKPAPTKEEIEAEKRAAIRARLGAATGLQAKSDDQAAGRAERGNAAAGNNPTSDGLGLSGRKRLNSPDPGIKNATGKVVVRITVNGEGRVTAVSFVRSSGFGSREQQVREACLSASRRLQYSPDPNKPTQRGEITWNIK